MKGVLLKKSTGWREGRLAMESALSETTYHSKQIHPLSQQCFLSVFFFHLPAFSFLPHCSELTLQMGQTDGISFPHGLHFWLC